MRESLLRELIKGYPDTCSVTDLRDGCVSFVRSPDYLKYIEGTDKDVYILISRKVWRQAKIIPSNVKPIFMDNPHYYFIIYHNEVNKDREPEKIIIGKNCNIHPTAVLGVEGMEIGISPEGRLVQCKHMKGLVIGDDVDIGPYCIVRRGCFDSTVIGRGAKIGGFCNVAHNVKIGEDTILTCKVLTNGSVRIGRDCRICTGAIIGNGVTICDEVVLGIGSVVIKDIMESGIYAGSPVKYLRPFSEWRKYDR